MRSRSRLLLTIVPLVAATIVGCETSSLVSTDPSPAKCRLVFTTPPMLDAGGGASSFGITTDPECGWDASSATDWISEIAPASGQGNADVRFRVAPNGGSSTREGEILVKGERVRVSQRAPCRLDVAPASQTMIADGGAGTVNIVATADCPWSATTDAAWIALAEPTNGSGSGVLRFTVGRNTGAPRVGNLIVGGQRSVITQAGNTPAPSPSCTYAIAPATQNIGAAGGTGAPVAVSTAGGCPWTASSNASWLAIASGATGNGAGSVGLSVAPNIGQTRTGTVTIAGQTATVTQAACPYSIAPTAQSVGAAGGAGTPVAVTTLSACQWTASSNATWITVTGGRGTGTGSATFTVAANSGAARNGTLTVAGQTASVAQAAPCTYGLSPTDQTLGAAGGSSGFNVVAPIGCGWTARSNAAWISIESGVTGSGNSPVSYRVEANSSGSSRTGTISIADQTFTVTQQGSGTLR
jgi:Putative binding domain, N-terminal/Viral BACON domain